MVIRASSAVEISSSTSSSTSTIQRASEDAKSAHATVAENTEGLDDDGEGVSRNISGDVIDHGLRRGLKGRQFVLIALGSIIGPGTFYGLGYALYLSGPLGLFIGFGLIGIAVWILMQSVGEVTTMFPVHGGFIEHTNRFVDPALSFALSWLYYIMWSIYLPSDWNAATLILQYWIPDDKFPSWAWYLIFWAIFSVITTLGVGVYGEIEYFFGMFKFCSLIVLFFISILANVGAFGNGYVGFKYWQPPDGPIINGINGFGQVFILAATYYVGTEVISLAAGESKNPQRDVPRSMSSITYRILVVYMGMAFFQGLICPSSADGLIHADSSTASSPFTIGFELAGWKSAGQFVNTIIIIAFLSAGSGVVYVQSRTLYSMALTGKAPAFFKVTTKRGVPVRAILFSNLWGFLALMNLGTSAGTVFTYFNSVSGTAAYFTWICISFTHLRVRSGAAKQGINPSTFPFRARGSIWLYRGNFAFFVFLLFIQGFTVFEDPFNWRSFIASYITIPTFVLLFFWLQVVPWDALNLKQSETGLFIARVLLRELYSALQFPAATKRGLPSRGTVRAKPIRRLLKPLLSTVKGPASSILFHLKSYLIPKKQHITPFKLHELTDNSEFDLIVPAQDKAYNTPFNAFWEMLKGESLEDWDARQKLWHHHNPTSHWIYATDEKTGKAAGAMQWNIHEKNPYEEGAPMLIADWWPEVTSYFFADLAFHNQGVGSVTMSWGLKKVDVRGMGSFVDSMENGEKFYAAHGYETLHDFTSDAALPESTENRKPTTNQSTQPRLPQASGFESEYIVYLYPLFHHLIDEALSEMQAVFNDDQLYKHSPIYKDEFRLALLQPATTENDPIRCRIVSTTDFTTSYEALSYTWRNPDLSWADIEVNGRRFLIPDNLRGALQFLRLRDHERVLWIDAICINQMDLEERGHQISNIQCIFQYASRVCIWLGEEDESSKRAMQFIEKLGQVSDLDNIVRDSTFDEEWRAVKGNHLVRADSIDWRQLDSCLALLVLKSQISMRYGPVTEFGASRLVDVVNQIFRRNELGEIQEPSLSLEALVTKLSPFQSTDPRDRIFALLGLANDTGRWSKTQEPWEHKFETASIEKDQGETNLAGPPGQEARHLQVSATDLQYLKVGEISSIQSSILESKQSREKPLGGQSNISIDYSKAFSQLCDEFVSFTIAKSGSLDIIFQPWAPDSSGSALSSWICTLDHQAFDLRSNEGWPEAVRINADPLVSRSGHSPTYSASGKFKAQKGWRISGNKDGSSGLRVMGAIVDSVDAIAAPAWGGNMPTEWLEFCGMSKDTVPEATWHTLVAGPMETTLHEFSDASVVDVNRIQRDEPGSIKSEFWRRAQAVIWDRSLIKTKQGRLGMVPHHAEIGDCICILFGCSVPVLLRESQYGIYRLVGESYIFGIMDGEALDIHNKAIETTWFDIESRKITRRPPRPLELALSLKPNLATSTLSLVRERNVMAGETQPATMSAHVPAQLKQFRLQWTCSCGHKGNDAFIEYRLGAMDELAKRLEDDGVAVSLEPLGLSDPFVDTIKMLIVHVNIFFANIFIDLAGAFRSRIGDRVGTSSEGMRTKPVKNPPTTASSKNKPLRVSATKGAQGSSSSPGQPRGQSSSGTIPLRSSSGVTTGASTATSSPVTADYVLLCINDSKFLITRDDLDLTAVVSDQQLFKCFRTRYFSRRNWIQRALSLKSLQNIIFVKFTLHENQEVDGLQPNQLPFTTDRHYSFDPRPPGLVPPFSSRFLKHRFKNPGWCRDSTVCLNQLPKRIERRPERGLPPDMFTGWGLYLQDDFSVRRICFWGLLGFIISLTFGISWSVKYGSISDGFAVAACILSFEAITLATIQFASGLVE
ncbi:hypothetical protein G7Y89_g10120 [Cudoniella acicularis]|uniref:Amino acid permease/ SLC12A domain-containing protein n=1 Tax=Cudoniella acicularis TaxID=354080 RepID=A0A8H4RFN7_9HELO|nr:hypothetical protein G7Y89_g10120 [Cudoniella acicularis]